VLDLKEILLVASGFPSATPPNTVSARKALIPNGIRALLLQG